MSGRMLYALLPIFLGHFCDLSNPCEQLLLHRGMITSSSAKHFPSPKMDIAWRNFAYLCKVPVSINFAMDFTCFKIWEFDSKRYGQKFWELLPKSFGIVDKH